MLPSQSPGTSAEAVPADIRERVMTAVLDELSRWGVERFSVEALAERHHLDAATIYRHWGDRQRLIVDAALGEFESLRLGTDTGSLRGDLLALTRNITDHISTEIGRAFLRAMVMDLRGRHDKDTRLAIWRDHFTVVRAVMDRARERGELRDGVNTLAATQIVLSPIYIRALYSDDAIEDGYYEAIADLAWHALARR